MNEFLTLKEIAEGYDVSERTLKRHIKKVTKGMTNRVRHNGVMVLKKEGNKWYAKRHYVEQFYNKRTNDTTSEKALHDNDKNVPRHDTDMSLIRDQLKAYQEQIKYLKEQIEAKDKQIERLEQRFDQKEDDTRILLSKLVEIQNKMIEAPKKRKGWFK